MRSDIKNNGVKLPIYIFLKKSYLYSNVELVVCQTKQNPI